MNKTSLRQKKRLQQLVEILSPAKLIMPKKTFLKEQICFHCKGPEVIPRAGEEERLGGKRSSSSSCLRMQQGRGQTLLSVEAVGTAQTSEAVNHAHFRAGCLGCPARWTLLSAPKTSSSPPPSLCSSHCLQNTTQNGTAGHWIATLPTVIPWLLKRGVTVVYNRWTFSAIIKSK